jgi:hypothetical protein
MDHLAPPFDAQGQVVYKYEIFDDSKQIRLLTLAPGKDLDPLHGRLDKFPLDDSDVPFYEALSYTWGSVEDPGYISIDSSNQRLAVTKDLATALRYLRHEEKPRVLWIDAVCVNQRDLDERSQQVKRMADIYTLAHRVVVWLGEDADDSDLALCALQDLGTKVKVDWHRFKMSSAASTSSAGHWADASQQLPYDEKVIKAIYHFFGRSWFRRLWIWQEIWLSSPKSVLLCGKHLILWEVFRNAIFCLFRKTFALDRIPFLPDYYLRRDHIYKLCNSDTVTSFLSLAELTTGSQCSDPRDRVYALLSLVPERARFHIDPDYKKTTLEVYQELFMHHVKQTQSLSILRYCELSEPRKYQPSWVPDLSRMKLTNSLQLVQASSKSDIEFVLLEDGILQVTGKTLSTVEHIFLSNIVPESTPEMVSLELKRLWSLSRISDLSVELTEQSSDRLVQFCRTIAADIFADRCRPVRTDFPDRSECLQELPELLGSTSFDIKTISPTMRRYLDTARYFLQDRSFYMTEDNQVGLGPRKTSTGDKIVMFLGCNSAMMLRPADREFRGHSCFHIVGETYCDGFMHGEALLGPIPRQYRKVQCAENDPPRRWYEFLDNQTVLWQDEDPRAGQLPPSWTIQRDEENPKQAYYINNETGEILGTRYFDPRLSTIELVKRVRLEEFMLV